jgi:hypothetical protein
MSPNLFIKLLVVSELYVFNLACQETFLKSIRIK